MLAVALSFLLAAVPLSDSTKADLNSPNYLVRDKARDALRAAFVPTDCTKWKGLVADLRRHKGANEQDVAAACSNFGVFFPGDSDAPSSSLWSIQLDRSWALECSFQHGQLQSETLLLQPPVLKLDPPPGYTGIWRTYRENGACVSQVYYSKGKPMGPLGDGLGNMPSF